MPFVPLPEHLPPIIKTLYRGKGGAMQSPYSGFNASGWPLDGRGWNGDEGPLPTLVAETAASVVVEVGSWKGSSSRTLGRALLKVAASKPDRPKPYMLCVDTWQGAPEFLTVRMTEGDANMDTYDLVTVHGYPHVYYQWLANIVHAGLQEVVFPLPSTSLIASEYIKRRDPDFRADVIYVDGSHEEADVLADVRAWFPFLRDNDKSVLIGDDFGDGWLGVDRAVATLVKTSCLPGTKVHGGEGNVKWWLFRRECPDLAIMPPTTKA